MDTDTRIECTNWDEDVPVSTWAKGRTRKPARKVLTKGVAKVKLTSGQMSNITMMLGSGMEVRLDFCGDDAGVGRELSGAMTRRAVRTIRRRWTWLLRGRGRSSCDINETER